MGVPTGSECEVGREGLPEWKGQEPCWSGMRPPEERDQWGEMGLPEWKGQEAQLGGMRPPEWKGTGPMGMR